MSTAAAFGVAIAIITIGGVALAGVLVWLMNRDARDAQRQSDTTTRA